MMVAGVHPPRRIRQVLLAKGQRDGRRRTPSRWRRPGRSRSEFASLRNRSQDGEKEFPRLGNLFRGAPPADLKKIIARLRKITPRLGKIKWAGRQGAKEDRKSQGCEYDDRKSKVARSRNLKKENRKLAKFFSESKRTPAPSSASWPVAPVRSSDHWLHEVVAGTLE
jgi:hypothetical protein